MTSTKSPLVESLEKYGNVADNPLVNSLTVTPFNETSRAELLKNNLYKFYNVRSIAHFVILTVNKSEEMI